MNTRLIITGGTFDKHYDEIQGELTFKDSNLPEILKTVRCTVPIEMEIIQMLDSLHMGEEHRAQILESCSRAKEDKIIITHGTDTMTTTARRLGKAKLPKTIILTGAMVPYAIRGSDAVFNLGCSLMASQTLPHGVYIVMNGQHFLWDNVKKNREKGIFETYSPL